MQAELSTTSAAILMHPILYSLEEVVVSWKERGEVRE